MSILRQTYEENFEKIYRYFYSRVLNQQIAEDLTSDTFIKFAESVTSPSTKIEDPKKYLFGIARNTFVKYLQEKYKKNESLFEIDYFRVGFDNSADYDPIETDHDDSKDYTLEELAARLLPHIPEKQRLVLQLRIIEKLSLKEICEKLNKDMNYVKTTQKRGLKSLRELVEKRDFVH
ncbi:MAG: sigma-70 family RNA polymerase sigma factor [Candidatus Dojkabacteria bacterium]